VGTGVADATTLAPGKVRLAGDLAGTANAPTVPALANKENTSNKSTNVNTDANSDTKYPSVKAIKTYVDQATQGIALQAAVDAKADKNSPIFTGTPSLPTGTIAVTQNGADNSTKLATTAFVQTATAAGIIDATTTMKGKLKLAGDLGGTAESPTVPGLAFKANLADVTSSLALKEDVSNKSTATALGTSDALYPSQKAVKTYVDSQIASATIADADASTKGKIQLAGDLGGTAASPTVTGLALKANTSDVNTALALKANSSDVTTALGLKANTSDVNTALALKANSSDVTTALGLKANSTDVNTSLALKEDASNKSTATTLGNSDALYPSQKAVKTYVDAQIASGAPNADASTKGKIQLAGDLGGTAASPTVPGLALKANTSDVNSALALKANSSDVTTALGLKANTSDVNTTLALKANSSDVNTSLALKEDTSNKSTATALGTSDELYPSQKAVKTYVDSQIASATIADADASSKGKIQLAGDLGGTAASPTVPGLALKANTYDVNTSLGLKANLADVTTSLATKVDKVTGKELSTNDYTTAEKTKLASAVPYMGATQAVDLGAFDLNVNGITVGKGGGNQSGNTVIGDNALVNNTYGIQNTSNGNWALFSNTTGIKNTASGVSALESNITGSYNTAIGSDANVGSGNLTNATAIGYQAVVNTSNTIQLGNTSITDVKTSGTLTAGTVTYPNVHNSTSGQVLITDGNGFASFGSIPVLNQTTTGSAATLTTPRTIHGGSFDGSADVTNIIASTYGGTGNGFTKFTGPSSSEKHSHYQMQMRQF